MSVVEARMVDCPKCNGEGCIEIAVTGGRFDSRMGQWYPDERVEECSLCEGNCVVPEVEAEAWESPWR